MDEARAVLEAPPGPGRIVAHFDGVHHSTESFVVEVRVGGRLAGTIGVYGHGDVLGPQEDLDRELAPFPADVDLSGAVEAGTGAGAGGIEVTWNVVGADGEARPPALFRFDRVSLRRFPG
ncbi:MAG TPA: hypothetical protein VGB14_09080 [Acidimicrobiales bacterium]|jgi:hypothetical protein